MDKQHERAQAPGKLYIHKQHVYGSVTPVALTHRANPPPGYLMWAGCPNTCDPTSYVRPFHTLGKRTQETHRSGGAP